MWVLGLPPYFSSRAVFLRNLLLQLEKYRSDRAVEKTLIFKARRASKIRTTLVAKKNLPQESSNKYYAKVPEGDFLNFVCTIISLTFVIFFLVRGVRRLGQHKCLRNSKKCVPSPRFFYYVQIFWRVLLRKGGWERNNCRFTRTYWYGGADGSRYKNIRTTLAGFFFATSGASLQLARRTCNQHCLRARNFIIIRTCSFRDNMQSGQWGKGSDKHWSVLIDKKIYCNF